MDRLYIEMVKNASEGRTPKELAILIKELKGMMFKKDETKEQHLTSNIFFTAYSYMLDTNKPAKECIIYAATIHMKDVEQVLAEKSNDSGKMSRKVVKQHNNHPIQKEMIKEKIFNRQALVNSKNLWQLLNTLSTFRQAYNWLKELREGNKDLRIRVGMAEAEISRLKELVGLGEMTDKEKLKYLKQSGATQEQVSEILSKSLSTIKRWWNQE